MNKNGKTTDNGRTRQKFCCPFRKSGTGECLCSHKNWNNGKKNRGCTKYKTIPTDYRLSIDRTCLYFKRNHALWTECERYNSRFKAAEQERLWVRNGMRQILIRLPISLHWPLLCPLSCPALPPTAHPNHLDVLIDKCSGLYPAWLSTGYGFCALFQPADRSSLVDSFHPRY